MIQLSLAVALEEALQAEKQRIIAEIRRYPSPIPACDAQFNYLLEQRDVVSQELHQLHTICTDGTTDDAVLRAFVALSGSLNEKTKAQLLKALVHEVST